MMFVIVVFTSISSTTNWNLASIGCSPRIRVLYYSKTETLAATGGRGRLPGSRPHHICINMAVGLPSHTRLLPPDRRLLRIYNKLSWSQSFMSSLSRSSLAWQRLPGAIRAFHGMRIRPSLIGCTV